MTASTLRISSIRTQRLLAVALLCAPLTGCGISVGAGALEEDSGTTETAALRSERLIVIDWDAGPSRMYDGEVVTPVDLSEFHLPDDSTLADEPNFTALVEARVQAIFNDLQPADVRIITGEASEYPDTTVVLMSFEIDLDDPRRVGQAYYDPCDTEPADEAIIWGLAMLELGDGHRLDEWVNLFANVTAHEVAHTLGFAHPEAAGDLGFRPQPTALMLASHSLDSLLVEQSFQIPQDTCPDDGFGLETQAGYQIPAYDDSVQMAGSIREAISADLNPDVACAGW